MLDGLSNTQRTVLHSLKPNKEYSLLDLKNVKESTLEALVKKGHLKKRYTLTANVNRKAGTKFMRIKKHVI